MQAITKYIVSFFLLVPLIVVLCSSASIIFLDRSAQEKLRVKNKISMSCLPPEAALDNHFPIQFNDPFRNVPIPAPGKHNDNNPGGCPHQAGTCTAAICEREKFTRKKKS
jgi:hypothetical protein